MLSTNELLDRAKAMNGVSSDYKLAQVLGVAKTAITNYRQGRSCPDDRVIKRLADLTGEDAGEAAVWMQIERARDDDARLLWRTVAARLAGHAHHAALAFVAVILSLFIGGGPDGAAMASQASPAPAAQSSAALYIMSTVSRIRDALRHLIFPSIGLHAFV